MTIEPDAPDWREGGVPVSPRFDDPYYSLENGLAETRHTFLAGNGLPDRFRDGFHVAELGFGTGLNLLATLHLWRQCGQAGQLRFTSFEAFPMAAADMVRAQGAFPELAGVAAASSRLVAATTAVASTGRAVAAGCATPALAAGGPRIAVRCFSRSLTRLRSSVTSSLRTDASPPLPHRELLSPSCSDSCEEILVVLPEGRLRFIEMTKSSRARRATPPTLDMLILYAAHAPAPRRSPLRTRSLLPYRL